MAGKKDRPLLAAGRSCGGSVHGARVFFALLCCQLDVVMMRIRCGRRLQSMMLLFRSYGWSAGLASLRIRWQDGLRARKESFFTGIALLDQRVIHWTPLVTAVRKVGLAVELRLLRR